MYVSNVKEKIEDKNKVGYKTILLFAEDVMS